MKGSGIFLFIATTVIISMISVQFVAARYCTKHEDCGDEWICNNGECYVLCVPGICGENSICSTENRREVCSCKPGYIGHLGMRCKKICSTNNECHDGEMCTPEGCRPIWDIARYSCGDDAELVIEKHSYSCVMKNCTNNDGCAEDKMCKAGQCVSACNRIRCGDGMACEAKNHIARCVCDSDSSLPLSSCGRTCKFDEECEFNEQCVRGICML